MRPINVLIVDDDEADILLTRRSLENDKLLVEVHEVHDGEQCLAFLRGEAPYAGMPRPELILLDLNMPRMGGLEVLEALRADEELRTIPVVVLTTSTSERDILKSYNLNANCFISKPVNLKEFQRVIGALEQFWFTVVRLPSA